MFKQAATCDDFTDLQEYTLSPPTSPKAIDTLAYSNPEHIQHFHTQRRPHHKDVC